MPAPGWSHAGACTRCMPAMVSYSRDFAECPARRENRLRSATAKSALGFMRAFGICGTDAPPEPDLAGGLSFAKGWTPSRFSRDAGGPERGQTSGACSRATGSGTGKERCHAARCHDITAGCRGSAGQQLVRNRLRGVFFFALNVWRLGANEQLGWTVQAHGPISRRYGIFSGAGRHWPWLHAFVCAGYPSSTALLCFSAAGRLEARSSTLDLRPAPGCQHLSSTSSALTIAVGLRPSALFSLLFLEPQY